MISRPSAVQVRPKSGRLSKVRRLGSPPVVGTTNTLLTTPAMAPRMKATCEPSGEKAGPSSRSSAGGNVSARLVESASDRSVIQEWVLVPLFSGNANTLPSGDQASLG